MRYGHDRGEVTLGGRRVPVAAAVQESEPAKALGLRVEPAYPLEERNQPFGPDSTVFRDPDERREAERVVRTFGERLWPLWPLGYRDGAALVCFPDNCPNNVPPILVGSKTVGDLYSDEPGGKAV